MQGHKGRWVLSPCVGHPPTARAGHTCATLGDVTFLFGGFDGTSRLRDLHAYHHPSTHGGNGGGQWTAEVEEDDCPPARSSHSAVFSHTQMIVFGGYDGAKSLNDLQAYDSVTGDWKELVGRGKAPSPRFGHSAVVHQQDKMYIFGGYDGVDRNDLYCFDFELMQWNAVLVKQGTPPPPRQYHSAVVYEDEMYVFGGKNGTRHYHDLHAFHFGSQSWRVVTAESVVKPWPRAGHTAVAFGSLMVVFGGMNGKQNFNDLSVYSIRTNRWTVVSIDGDVPAERRAHSAVISSGGHLCIFGGSDGAKRFDDIYSFDLSVLPKELEDETTSGTVPAATTAAAATEETFTAPVTPPPKEWRQSRARMDTAPAPVSPSVLRDSGTNRKRGTVSLSPQAAAAAAVGSPRAQEEPANNGRETQKNENENEGQAEAPRSDAGGDVTNKSEEPKGKNMKKSSNAETDKSESESESDKEQKRKRKEQKRKEKSEIRRREKEARRSRQVAAVAENGASTETAADASPAPVANNENGAPTPTSQAAQSTSSSTSSSPPRTTFATPPSTPVKLEERSGSRIALLKARFDATSSGSSTTTAGASPGALSGSPSSGSPNPRSLSRRSVAYPVSHQQHQQQLLQANEQVEVVEKLRGEVTELRGRLDEREREVTALRERLDARDVELQKLADGMAKQMKKLKRDLKKLKKEKKPAAKADGVGKDKKTTPRKGGDATAAH